jgi:hypothetical protein
MGSGKNSFSEVIPSSHVSGPSGVAHTVLRWAQFKTYRAQTATLTRSIPLMLMDPLVDTKKVTTVGLTNLEPLTCEADAASTTGADQHEGKDRGEPMRLR